MIVICAWCQKQVIDAHDCPERREGLLAMQGKPLPDYSNTATSAGDSPLIETQQREILAIDKEAAANPPMNCAQSFTIQYSPCAVRPVKDEDVS